ncbi:MAG: hypothetical protein K2X66_00020 [Cyanobacteria bacterium]|nr:hypothetical protein [Cyanobacteriota bacterium]
MFQLPSKIFKIVGVCGILFVFAIYGSFQLSVTPPPENKFRIGLTFQFPDPLIPPKTPILYWAQTSFINAFGEPTERIVSENSENIDTASAPKHTRQNLAVYGSLNTPNSVLSPKTNCSKANLPKTSLKVTPQSVFNRLQHLFQIQIGESTSPQKVTHHFLPIPDKSHLTHHESEPFTTSYESSL